MAIDRRMCRSMRYGDRRKIFAGATASVAPPAPLRPLGCPPASNLSAAHPPPTSRRSTHLPTHTHLRSLPSHPPPTDLSAAYPPPTSRSPHHPPPTSRPPIHLPPLGHRPASDLWPPVLSATPQTAPPPTHLLPLSRPAKIEKVSSKKKKKTIFDML